MLLSGQLCRSAVGVVRRIVQLRLRVARPVRRGSIVHRRCSASADVAELSADVSPLEQEVRQLLSGASAFDVMQGMCARATPPVPSPILEHYSFNDGNVRAVRSALRLGSAVAMQVAHMQDRIVPLDERCAESQLPTVELFLERMAAHPRGLYDVRELEKDAGGGGGGAGAGAGGAGAGAEGGEGGTAATANVGVLWPEAVRAHAAQCDAVLRLNFRAVQLLLWALAPPQALDDAPSRSGGRGNGAGSGPQQQQEEQDDAIAQQLRAAHRSAQPPPPPPLLLPPPPPPPPTPPPPPPRRQRGVTRRLEHVWRKRGQQSALKLDYGDGATAFIGQQSHGAAMVLDALQAALLRSGAPHNNNGNNSNNPFGTPHASSASGVDSSDGDDDDHHHHHRQQDDYLTAAVPSRELQESLATLLLDALLTSGPLLNRRVSLGRATTVVHPFLVAWTQRNVIVDQIDKGALRLLASNFRALADNARMRDELLRAAPTVEMCLAGTCVRACVRACVGALF